MAYFEVKNIDWVYEKFDDEGDDGEYVPEEHYCVRIEQNVRSLLANNKEIKHFNNNDIISVVINKIQIHNPKLVEIHNKTITVYFNCKNCKERYIRVRRLANGRNNLSGYMLKHFQNLCERNLFK